MAETTPNVALITAGGTALIPITHTGVTAQREVIAGCITQRRGLTITAAASTPTVALAPGAAAGTGVTATRGLLLLGLIPAVAPLRRNGDLTTSLAGKGNTKQDIWRKRPKTLIQMPTATPPFYLQNTRRRAGKGPKTGR